MRRGARIFPKLLEAQSVRRRVRVSVAAGACAVCCAGGACMQGAFRPPLLLSTRVGRVAEAPRLVLVIMLHLPWHDSPSVNLILGWRRVEKRHPRVAQIREVAVKETSI